ncbi:hypothetical protein BgiMline_017665 [Biomphalaria glabrata]|nr:hypothetical protein BgiMline_005302 [Biomphalaria glabrata]
MQKPFLEFLCGNITEDERDMTNKLLSSSNSRCKMLLKRLHYAFKVFLFIFMFLLLSMFIPLLRNTFLYPVWPKPWRHIGTVDLLMMEFFTEGPQNVVSLNQCPAIVSPNVSQSDPRLLNIQTYDEISEDRIRYGKHKHFLPLLNEEKKRRLVQTYLVLSDALNRRGVQFFLRAGTLIGVLRHRGLIPWDDDMDIAIHVKDWMTVREVLSCIEGYVLKVDPIMHWKFFVNTSWYPFIDIFFYTGNDEYVWAITDYTRRTMVLEISHVFPLSTGVFEGIEVPTPKDTEIILRKQYDLDTCVSRSSNHETSQPLPEVDLPCSSLFYLYDMFHVNYVE